MPEVKFETVSDKEPTLEEAQAFVGGMVQLVELPDGRQLMMDEEGKIKGKPVNAEATDLWVAHFGPTDLLVGDVMVLEGDAVWK